ncbi:hypothetical protein HMPREF1991_01058 [Hoylesella loescheii DSM 19665 = JCM 12249 = ATCC 15930]|uniref:Uncharacterized protein n=1 Tax=Hoylesella loescheii DSM 19665 = JCM 12249 = ATCC 15930 TaxID=1122985 RepID=A0A069QJ23_HOYLO|nr:hypothetical protein HMPREF1991_01058 [Hoylesella loescheii DSM 19665 = JCM 12249 = ATCC 15930]
MCYYANRYAVVGVTPLTCTRAYYELLGYLELVYGYCSMKKW